MRGGSEIESVMSVISGPAGAPPSASYSGTPCNGKSRKVPLSDDAIAILRSLPSRFPGENVFAHEDGRMLTKGDCKHPLWRACRRAGLRRIGWHVARHSFASHLAMRGVSL